MNALCHWSFQVINCTCSIVCIQCCLSCQHCSRPGLGVRYSASALRMEVTCTLGTRTLYLLPLHVRPWQTWRVSLPKRIRKRRKGKRKSSPQRVALPWSKRWRYFTTYSVSIRSWAYFSADSGNWDASSQTRNRGKDRRTPWTIIPSEFNMRPFRVMLRS